MTPEEILSLVDELRKRGVHAFECSDFKVSMQPAASSAHEEEPITTFEDVNDEVVSAEPEPVFRGYTAADLGLD